MSKKLSTACHDLKSAGSFKHVKGTFITEITLRKGGGSLVSLRTLLKYPENP